MYGWPYDELPPADAEQDDADAEQAEADALADRLADHTPATTPPRFDFPPLGPTGEGEVQRFAEDDRGYWVPAPYTGYWVTRQHDVPAIAFRCHYPGGSSPCDRETADRFIEWAKNR